MFGMVMSNTHYKTYKSAIQIVTIWYHINKLSIYFSFIMRGPNNLEFSKFVWECGCPQSFQAASIIVREVGWVWSVCIFPKGLRSGVLFTESHYFLQPLKGWIKKQPLLFRLFWTLFMLTGVKVCTLLWLNSALVNLKNKIPLDVPQITLTKAYLWPALDTQWKHNT